MGKNNNYGALIMGKCVICDIQNPNEAYEHMMLQPVKEYGKFAYGHPLFCWDSGERTLCKCEKCGGYVLIQESEYHGTEDDDYYTDYIPVNDSQEAEEINRQFSGFDLEYNSEIKYLAKTGNHCEWRH